jgi:hypothetical protein
MNTSIMNLRATSLLKRDSNSVICMNKQGRYPTNPSTYHEHKFFQKFDLGQRKNLTWLSKS